MVGKTIERGMKKQKLKSSAIRDQNHLDQEELELGNSEDLKLIREAVEQLRLTAERVELDKQIAGGQQVTA